MLSKLRGAVGKDYDPAGETGLDALRDIGISTGKAGIDAPTPRPACSSIDDAALTAALDADAPGRAQPVRRRRRRRSRRTSGKLADDLGKTLDARVESTTSESKRADDQMTRMDTRLEAKEKRLKAQFAAMETAMGASQTQLAWLQGQLASLPTWS